MKVNSRARGFLLLIAMFTQSLQASDFSASRKRNRNGETPSSSSAKNFNKRESESDPHDIHQRPSNKQRTTSNPNPNFFSTFHDISTWELRKILALKAKETLDPKSMSNEQRDASRVLSGPVNFIKKTTKGNPHLDVEALTYHIYQALCQNDFPELQSWFTDPQYAVRLLEAVYFLNDEKLALDSVQQDALFHALLVKLHTLYPHDQGFALDLANLPGHGEEISGSEVAQRLAGFLGFALPQEMLGYVAINEQRVTADHLAALQEPMNFIKQSLKASNLSELELSCMLHRKLVKGEFPALQQWLGTAADAVQILDAAHYLGFRDDMQGLPDVLLYRVVELHRNNSLLKEAVAANFNHALAARIYALLSPGEQAVNYLSINPEAASFYDDIQELVEQFRSNGKKQEQAFYVKVAQQLSTEEPHDLFQVIIQYMNNPDFREAMQRLGTQSAEYLYLMLRYYQCASNIPPLAAMPYGTMLHAVAKKLHSNSNKKALYLSNMFNSNDILSAEFSAILPRFLSILERLQGCKLQSLYLSGNQLTGEIPGEHLAKLTQLQSLNLSRNQLTGEIPGEHLAKLTQLQSLNLSCNELTGEIPGEHLAKLTQLQSLDLCRNELTGEIPGEHLAKLTQLQSLNLFCNQLTGEIPGEHLAKLTQLQSLNLSCNELTGEIPGEHLAKLTQLQRLNLSDNQLTGEIPGEHLAKLTQLQSLNLSRNQLAGRISLSLANKCISLVVDPQNAP